MRVEHFLTLTQPWATLMAIGAKKIETRGWPIRFRGWFAIHAAKGFPAECRDLCYQAPFVDVFRAAGWNVYSIDLDLPLGKVLAVTELIECRRITAYENRTVQEPERSFGDYTLGRHAFVTEGVRRLKEPFALRGMQRLQRLPEPITEEQLI